MLAIVERDLRDCRAQSLSPEWQLSITYNTILQAATGWGSRNIRISLAEKALSDLITPIPVGGPQWSRS